MAVSLSFFVLVAVKSDCRVLCTAKLIYKISQEQGICKTLNFSDDDEGPERKLKVLFKICAETDSVIELDASVLVLYQLYSAQKVGL